MFSKKIFSIIIIILITSFFIFKFNNTKDNLPIVAIANYGPHSSIDSSMEGIKNQLTREGFIDGETIRLKLADVGFDHSLISQMISQLRSTNPKVLIVTATPVAQYAKGAINNIPLVYNLITDPTEAGLIKNSNFSDNNMTGSSDKQDLGLMFAFAKELLPNAKSVGLLYSPSEANDVALVNMMRKAADEAGLKLLAIPVTQTRDIAISVQNFKNNVDFLYVGTSGPIQPALAVIAAECNKMSIPIINVDEGAVKDGIVLASFGVDYMKVGENTGKLVAKILEGADIAELTPLYPLQEEHRGFINRKIAEKFNIKLRGNIKNVEIVE